MDRAVNEGHGPGPALRARIEVHAAGHNSVGSMDKVVVVVVFYLPTFTSFGPLV